MDDVGVFPDIFTFESADEPFTHVIPSETILLPLTFISNVPEPAGRTAMLLATASAMVIPLASPVSTATSAPSPVIV